MLLTCATGTGSGQASVPKQGLWALSTQGVLLGTDEAAPYYPYGGNQCLTLDETVRKARGRNKTS